MDEASVYRAFGRAIASKRQATGKTQAQVAREIGLSRGSLANIEVGNQKVFLHQILAIAHALQLKSLYEIVPPMVVGPIEKSSKRPKVIGSRSLTPHQRQEIEALLNSLTVPPPNGEAGAG